MLNPPRLAESAPECDEIAPPIQINGPGTFVLHGEDILLRISAEAAADGSCAGVLLSGGGAVRVTRISEDPCISLRQARNLLSENDLPVRL